MRVPATPEEDLLNRPTGNTATSKRKGAGIKAWLVVNVSGQSHLEQVGKHSIMRRTGLPARDLRILDPFLSYPSSILGRERAIVINLEHIKAIITATEVLVLNSTDPSVAPFVQDLQQRVSDSYGASRKLVNKNNDDSKVMDKALVSPQFAADYHSASTHTGISQRVHASLKISPMVSGVEDNNQGPTLDMSKDGGPKILPFELKALEVCLECACRGLESETSALEQEAYPVLDELTSKLSTLNLERVRQIKSRLVAISGRVQKVRDELEHLLDDDMDMAEMYLTDKLVHQSVDNASSGDDLDDDALQLDDESDEDADSIDGKTEITVESFTGSKPDIKELEMLLEAYFVQTYGTLNKLSTMREYVDGTEDFINLMLDDKQNQLLRMGVILSTASLILTMAILVMGLLGMNIHIDLFQSPPNTAFLQATYGTVGGGIFLYVVCIAWGMKKGLLG